jgi:hypothetical protein
MKFNDAAFVEMGKSAGVRRLTEEAAARVLSAARASAPVDTGDYKAGLGMRLRETRFRVVWLVVGTDWKTMLVESKTANLQKALRAARRG